MTEHGLPEMLKLHSSLIESRDKKQWREIRLQFLRQLYSILTICTIQNEYYFLPTRICLCIHTTHSVNSRHSLVKLSFNCVSMIISALASIQCTYTVFLNPVSFLTALNFNDIFNCCVHLFRFPPLRGTLSRGYQIN